MNVWVVTDEKWGECIGVYDSPEKAYESAMSFIKENYNETEAKEFIEELTEHYRIGTSIFYAIDVVNCEKMKVR